MLSLGELCEWLNITERHARKLVERDAIPYRKIGHLLRFPESEIDEWSRPKPRAASHHIARVREETPARARRPVTRSVLPKSLIE
jgi:excisionase family DNA binding protein